MATSSSSATGPRTPTRPTPNTLIVTHKPNILDAFGKDWFEIEIKEGEASIFKPEGSGFARVARVQISQWATAMT